LQAVVDPASGETGFNVELGGYFSIKRNVMSLSGDTFLTQDQVVPYCKALLEVFRDNGGREDRQKARLMWLVEEWGVERFRLAIADRMGQALRTEVHVAYGDVWERRDVMGIHPQKQEGMFWVGAVVPAGRMLPSDFAALADVADRCASRRRAALAKPAQPRRARRCRCSVPNAFPNVGRQVRRRHGAADRGGERGHPQRARGQPGGAAAGAHLPEVPHPRRRAWRRRRRLDPRVH
jgi:hypothetical protein